VTSTLDSSGYHDRLVDGTLVDLPQNTSFKLLGGGDPPGWLLLAGTADGGFSLGLEPSGDGCWEAWRSPLSDQIVWDLGDSILFTTGIELPKAVGFHADPEPQQVDGHLAWAVPVGDVGSQWMSFCANSKGQIESGIHRP
jgi:hypothetical protein